MHQGQVEGERSGNGRITIQSHWCRLYPPGNWARKQRAERAWPPSSVFIS